MADINEKIILGIEADMDASKVVNSVGSIKKELKIAQQELVTLADKFGLTSKEAEKAAKKVADIRDRIGDAKQLAETFNPDKKFVALQGSVNGALGAFSALTGAMGLLGTESKDVEKLLLKVQSAMAIQQGISSIMASVDSFKLLAATIEKNVVAAFTTMKGAMISTGIGALIVGIGLLIANFDTLKDSVTGTTAEVKVLNETQKDFNKGTEDAVTNVNKVTTAFSLAEKGVITKKDALKTYNETLGDSLGKQTDLTKAEQIVADKAEDYIKIMGLKAQANALFALSGQLVAKSLLAQTEDQTSWVDKTIAGFLGTSGAAYLVKEQINGVTDATAKYNEQAGIAQKKGEELALQAYNISKSSGIKTDFSGNKPASTKSGKTAAELAQEESTKIITIERDKRQKLENEATNYAIKSKQSAEELGKVLLQISIDSDRKILGYEKLTTKDRLSVSTQLISERRQQQIQEDEEIKKSSEKRKLFYQKMAGDYTKVQKDFQNEHIQELKDATTDELTELSNRNNSMLGGLETFEEDKKKIIKKGLQQLKDYYISIGRSVVDINNQLANIGSSKGKDKPLDKLTADLMKVFPKMKKGLADAISGTLQAARIAIGALADIFNAQSQRRTETYQRTKSELADLEAADQAYSERNGGLHDKMTQAQIANTKLRMAKEYEAAKKSFDIAKKMAIAQAVIGGLMAVISVWSAQSALPDPYATILKVIETAAVVALTATQIAGIKSQQFEGGGSSMAPTSMAKPSPDIVSPQASMISNMGQTQMGTQNGMQVQKVYVVESDITRSQRRVAVTQGRSVLGH